MTDLRKRVLTLRVTYDRDTDQYHATADEVPDLNVAMARVDTALIEAAHALVSMAAAGDANAKRVFDQEAPRGQAETQA